jgi:tetratricopeptide (TPR) repeat protein
MVQYSGAEPIMLKALSMITSLYGDSDLRVAKANYLLAELYWNQGKWDLAEPRCQKALEIREKILGPNHPEVAMALVGLGGMPMGVTINSDCKKRWR